MISKLLSQARTQARHSAGTAGIGLFAGLALCVGLAFWTGAAWYLLVTLTSPFHACLILGAIYTGAALIGFAIVAARADKPSPPPEPEKKPEATMDNLVSAFMTGLSAGARTRS